MKVVVIDTSGRIAGFVPDSAVERAPAVEVKGERPLTAFLPESEAPLQVTAAVAFRVGGACKRVIAREWARVDGMAACMLIAPQPMPDEATVTVPYHDGALQAGPWSEPPARDNGDLSVTLTIDGVATADAMPIDNVWQAIRTASRLMTLRSGDMLVLLTAAKCTVHDSRHSTEWSTLKCSAGACTAVKRLK